jgi:hypothetical protein
MLQNSLSCLIKDASESINARLVCLLFSFIWFVRAVSVDETSVAAAASVYFRWCISGDRL